MKIDYLQYAQSRIKRALEAMHHIPCARIEERGVTCIIMEHTVSRMKTAEKPVEGQSAQRILDPERLCPVCRLTWELAYAEYRVDAIMEARRLGKEGPGSLFP